MEATSHSLTFVEHRFEIFKKTGVTFNDLFLGIEWLKKT